jgi:hypothetical protein
MTPKHKRASFLRSTAVNKHAPLARTRLHVPQRNWNAMSARLLTGLVGIRLVDPPLSCCLATILRRPNSASPIHARDPFPIAPPFPACLTEQRDVSVATVRHRTARMAAFWTSSSVNGSRRDRGVVGYVLVGPPVRDQHRP